MNVRQPARAGTFYEASESACRRHAEKLLDACDIPADLPDTLYGGIVPHAGWMFSGKLAAMTFKALASRGTLSTVVLFGADHTGVVRRGEVFDSGAWRTPLGDVAVDEQLAAELLAGCELLRANPHAHAQEHSIEVQVPLLQVAAPGVKIVPVAVPPVEIAVEIGNAVGRTLAERFPDVRVVGSTDLTHHGGHFPAPGGRGPTGVRWTEQNDKRMLELIQAMKAPEVIDEAASRMNACGAGAVAATIAACQAMGATRGLLLAYTHSYAVVHEMYPNDPDDTTVGYASVVFA